MELIFILAPSLGHYVYQKFSIFVLPQFSHKHYNICDNSRCKQKVKEPEIYRSKSTKVQNHIFLIPSPLPSMARHTEEILGLHRK